MSDEHGGIELTEEEARRVMAAHGQPFKLSALSAARAIKASAWAAARKEALMEAAGALLGQADGIEDHPVTALDNPDVYRIGRKDGYLFGAGTVAHLDDPEEKE